MVLFIYGLTLVHTYDIYKIEREMTVMLDLDFAFGQGKDWKALSNAIDEADREVPCQNFPEAFFPEVGEAAYYAKAMCSDCPVRAQCAEYGVKWETYGIWGGLAPRERDKLRRALERRAS